MLDHLSVGFRDQHMVPYDNKGKSMITSTNSTNQLTSVMWMKQDSVQVQREF